MNNINWPIKNQNAKYKYEENLSKETSINISKQIFDFLGGKNSGDIISVVLRKKDFLLAFSKLSLSLPLSYYHNGSQEADFDSTFFSTNYKEIEEHFGTEEEITYKVKLTINTKTTVRYYMYRIDGLKSFIIRDFLIGENSSLNFIKRDDGSIVVQPIIDLLTDDKQLDVIESVCDKKITLPSEIKHCARRIINYLYAADEFKSIEPFLSIGKTDSTVTIDDKNSIKMNGVFFTPKAPNYEYSGEGKVRAFYNTDYNIKVENKNYICHLIVDWYKDAETDQSKKNSALLVSLIEMVNKYYSFFYYIENNNGEYILLNKKNIHVIDDTFDYSKEKFTNSLNKLINKKHENDENNFAQRYVKSLLTKKFVILSGNSGTGKTKISKNFANLLGKSFDDSCDIDNKLIVPVGSDWTDNTKVLGFYNPITHLYQPTEILKFILSAKVNSAIPYFLVLDEMNLSHVERYFSDFLSAMESGEVIPLYKRDTNCKEEIIPESIDLPENLFVTGTVNIDETTYMFSPKVLDRANVIEFIPAQSDVLANFATETQPEEITPVNDGSAEGFLALAKTVREKKDLPPNSDICKTILEGISNILDGSGFEFAFRTVKEIRLYINAAYALAQNEGKTLSEEDYVHLMDEQLLQKILPKIHGNRKQIGNLLEKLETFCTEKSLSLSLAKVQKMKARLENYQYASFI